MPDLTYAKMVEIINSGESVLLDGTIINTIEALPLPEQLAESAGDKAAIEADLRAQMTALQSRLLDLESTTARFGVSADTLTATTDSTDSLPEEQINPADGYVANHKALLAKAKAAGFTSSLPNPSRAVLVEWLNAQKQGA